jgi:hypothetical protein
MRSFAGLLLATALLFGATASALTPPPTVNGLKVTRENVASVHSKRKQYLTHIELFSLRRGKQLEATLQVGTFERSAPVRSLTFQRGVAGQVGATVPVEQRIAGTTVFVTQAKKLAVAVWFRGSQLYVLSIRTDYDTPKSLIRAVLELPA